jgi:hypothetical protein
MGSRAAPGGATPEPGAPPTIAAGDDNGTSGRIGAVEAGTAGDGVLGIRCSKSPGRGLGDAGIVGTAGALGGVKGV